MSILEKRIYFLRDIQQEYIPKKLHYPSQKKTKWTQKLLLIKLFL